ncbi:MAG: sigma-70 family RNA polymerase sigma factor, partial [Actinomycetota bacterium]|nr:sigma-70 family RNA polymerase sigma factor [Actinomycetota bacterium]
MTTLTTDARLVTDFLAGDKSALAAIYDRYAPGLYDTAAAMLSDRHDAADMVQDVFCIAAERLGQLREPDRLKPWLYSVLRHEVYRRTKKRKRAVPVDFQDEGTPDVASGYDPHEAGEAIAHDELATLVRSAASGLDERDRLVLELSVRQGLAGADLADALGVTPEQSYSLVHRMRDRVEKSLGALTVAKAGRRECSQLDQILSGWDGELTILLRKRVNRHIEECATCDRTRKKYAPLALFGAAPVFAMPFGLRERVLAAAIPGGTGTGSDGSSGSDGASGAWSSPTTRNIRFDAHKGFPRAARAGRHVVAWAAAATAVAVLGGAVLVATAGDDTDGSSGASASVEADSSGFGAPVTSDELSSSDDRQIVSGGGSVIQIFGDDDTPATI